MSVETRPPRASKVAVVDEIRSQMSSADALLLTEYRGLSVSELARLRGVLRPTGTSYKIYKNTLVQLAATELGHEGLAELLTGPTAIAFVRGDAVQAAKALRDFGRGNELLVLKGGLLGNKALSGADVTALADIEPREVLLARLAGAMKAPMTKAAGLFQAMTRNTAYAVKALIDKRVADGEAPPPAAEVPAAPEPAAADAATAPVASEASDEPVADEAAGVDQSEAEPSASDESGPEAAGPEPSEPAAETTDD